MQKYTIGLVGIVILLALLLFHRINPFDQTASMNMVMGTPTNVGPAGSLPHWLMYHSEDSPGGMLPPSTSPLKEWVPDLANKPTKTATAGNWSQIWASSTPNATDVVMIPAGVTVNYDIQTASTTVKTIGVKGTFIFDPNQDTQLKVGTIFVYQGGSLIIKPSSSVKHEISISGTLNTKEDPGQYSLGIVAVGGTVDIEGSNNPTSFLRYTRAEAGESTITFASSPQNWKAGDELVLAGNINTASGSAVVNEERITIQAVRGSTVTLTAPLKYTHHIFIDSGGTYQRVPGIAGHITRNVLIHSENPSVLMQRGHIMLMDQTYATVKNTEIEGLGRTTNSVLNDTKRDSTGNMTSVGANPRGRYPLHAHHVTVPFLFENNAMVNEVGDIRWGIVNHNSFGTIKNNIVVFKGGSGIVTEYGTETGPIVGNAVIGLGGGSGEDDGSRIDANGVKSSVYDFGQGGFGFWFGNRTSEVSKNITDGLFLVAGFDYYVDWYGRGNEQPVTRPDNVPDQLPFVQEAAPDLYGGVANLTLTPNRLFEGNVNYAHSGGPALLNEWDISGSSIFRNFTSYDGGVALQNGGEERDVVLDGVHLYGLGTNPGIGVYGGDRNQDEHILNSEIINFSTGITGQNQLIDLRNTKVVNAVVPIRQAALLEFGLLPDVAPIYKQNYSETSNLRGSNQAPVVSLVNLDRGAVFNTQSTVSLQASAQDPDGSITKVEFYNSEKKVFADTNSLYNNNAYNYSNEGTKIGDGVINNGVWTFAWVKPLAGKYKISAKATDNNGATTIVGNIPIDVVAGNLGAPVFYRGIDFGSANSSIIDGNIWEPAITANNVDFKNYAAGAFCTDITDNRCPISLSTYSLNLTPVVSDQAKADMIRSGFRYSLSADGTGSYIPGTNKGLTLTNVPAGVYQVYLYNSTYAANNMSFFSIAVQDNIESTVNSVDRSGKWSKFGPYTAVVDSSGRLNIKYYFPAREGLPPFVAGLEVYRLMSTNAPLNMPPHVLAGISNIDRSNPLVVSAQLSAAVTDDGLSGIPVSGFWKVWKGPADVYFTNQNSFNANAQFFRAGTYELQFIGSDGQYNTESNVVTVDVPIMPTVFSSAANAALSGATFYKAYNLGGGAVTINGRSWMPGNSSEVSVSVPFEVSNTYNASGMPLYPNDSNAQDPSFASMLRDGNRNSRVTISNIASGNYEVYFYTVDLGGGSNVANIELNNQSVAFGYDDFGRGSWKKMGPFTIPITGGALVLSSSFDSVSFAGVELWSAPASVPVVSIPPPSPSQIPPPTPTPDPISLPPPVISPVPPQPSPSPATSGSWYNSSWTNSKKLTIDHTKVPNIDQTNFPVLISITDSNLKTTAQSSGNDILFTSADGITKLNHEIESYDPTTGKLVAWVKVPVLSHTLDTSIYMYFGNASAGGQSNKTAVWDSNYKGVWHLPNGAIISGSDSTSNGFNLTNSGATATTGQMDGGISVATTPTYLSGSNPTTATNNLTLSGWFNPAVANTNHTGLYNGGGGDGYGIGFNGSNWVIDMNFISYFDTGISVQTGVWQYIALVFDSGTAKLYKNGVLAPNTTGAGASAPTTAFYVGANVGAPRTMQGSIDEVRISNVVRSTDWIKTEYNNQSAPLSFIDVGSLLSQSTPTLPPTPLSGDFNGDGLVDLLDLNMIRAKWNQTLNISPYDLNNDGIVNSLDFSILNRNWKK